MGHIVRLTMRRFHERRQTDRLIRQFRGTKHLIDHLPIESVHEIRFAVLVLGAQQRPQFPPDRMVHRPTVVPQELFNVLLPTLLEKYPNVTDVLQRFGRRAGRYYGDATRIHQRGERGVVLHFFNHRRHY